MTAGRGTSRITGMGCCVEEVSLSFGSRHKTCLKRCRRKKGKQGYTHTRSSTYTPSSRTLQHNDDAVTRRRRTLGVKVGR